MLFSRLSLREQQDAHLEVRDKQRETKEHVPEDDALRPNPAATLLALPVAVGVGVAVCGAAEEGTTALGLELRGDHHAEEGHGTEVDAQEDELPSRAHEGDHGDAVLRVARPALLAIVAAVARPAALLDVRDGHREALQLAFREIPHHRVVEDGLLHDHVVEHEVPEGPPQGGQRHQVQAEAGVLEEPGHVREGGLDPREEEGQEAGDHGHHLRAVRLQKDAADVA
mmetsp:Transcript_156094/g.479053  ORF Transcript_156094/g.479053 Transcript_156094/m.479053 type:complete len:226 (-) Transcript_156094:283-960(-)